MSCEQSFFDEIERHYASKLPFVVYSRPINSIIKCWLQNDECLHETDSFNESGFVFAPFDLENQAVVLPETKCIYNEIQISSLEVKPLGKNELNLNIESKESHINLVTKGIESITNGDFQKVVLSRIEKHRLVNQKPIDTFKRLFNTYKNAMVYCWYHPKVGLWMGATPELLFKVEGPQLTAVSLAGTQTYKPNESPKWTTKELEEQQIVTNYLADQIAPYANKTNISEIQTTRAGNLLHLKTYLTSRIKPEIKLKSIIEALHPTPAVCGMPKEIAKSFILKNENYKRDFYTGFLGELNLKQIKSRNSNNRNIENNAYRFVKKCSNFYVNLRCVQIKDGYAFIYVGGGITKSSNPEKEWLETCNKTMTIKNVLG